MKSIFIFSVICFVAVRGYTQDVRVDTSSVYYQSLKYHLVHVERLFPFTANPTREVYVETNDITKNLPKKIYNFQIEYLDRSSIYEKTRKNRKGWLHLIRIFPVVIGEDYLEIGIANYAVQSKNRHNFSYSLNNSTYCYYKFDCSKNKFILDKKIEH